MPVNILTQEQIAQYGHYAGEPSPTQLAKYSHLDDGDHKVISSLRGQHSRLGFALQLCTVRFLGCFLTDLTETPSVVVNYLAHQLGIENSKGWESYAESKTESRHRQFIRDHYGYEDFHQSLRPFTLLRQLSARAWLTQESNLALFDHATAWLVQNKVLLPGATVLERWIARIVNRANQRLWHRLVELVDARQRNQLQSLLIVDKNERFSRLELLRRPATRPSSPTIKHSIHRLEKVRAVGVNGIDLSSIPIGHVKAMARYGMSAWASAIDDLGDDHKLATLLVTIHELEAVIQDEVIDLLLLNVADKFKDAEKAGLKARMQALAQLDAATLQLCAACQFILNKELPEDEVLQAIFKEIPRQELEKAVTLVNRETSPHAPYYYNLLVDGYRSLRLFLPALLKAITFKGMAASEDILAAWQFLHKLDHERPRPDIQDAPQDVVGNVAWRAVVFNQEDLIDRRYYTFCVLHYLSAALQRRDVFISPSRRWQDQRAQLVHGEA